jgi:hypothetical protein
MTALDTTVFIAVLSCARALRRVGFGAQLTGRQMRTLFTICPRRPAASETGTAEGEARKKSAGTRRARECYAAGAAARGTTGDLALARRRACASCGCACVPGQI